MDIIIIGCGWNYTSHQLDDDINNSIMRKSKCFGTLRYWGIDGQAIEMLEEAFERAHLIL